jgi:hypothetical protein
MLMKTPDSNFFDEMPTGKMASKIVNCWPAAIVSICLTVTVAWVGFLAWLVLFLSGHAP